MRSHVICKITSAKVCDAAVVLNIHSDNKKSYAINIKMNASVCVQLVQSPIAPAKSKLIISHTRCVSRTFRRAILGESQRMLWFVSIKSGLFSSKNMSKVQTRFLCVLVSVKSNSFAGHRA